MDFMVLNRRISSGILLIIWATCAITGSASAEPLAPAQLEFFEARIRPVLVEQCYRCHNSSGRAEGGLAVDQRGALLQGGDGGAIVIPGQPAASRVFAILRHEIDGLNMPQEAGKLDRKVVADFEQWIAMGVPDPRDRAPSAAELATATAWDTIFQKRKQWWSFQPVVKPAIPEVQNRTWSPHPVDRFLLAAMEQRGLTPAAPADRRALLRRLTYVLTGLPPTPAAVDAFLADESSTAYLTVVGRLFDSSRFGERFARHWMDLVRYCESHGSQGDPVLHNAYRYRDYLIRAFNADLPYNQLVREHLAGDLLATPRWNVKEQFCESAIGPAHLRMVELGYLPKDALEDQVKVVDNQIDVYSKAFLGLTVSCARCHNHKFDPISQEDFYALYGIFVSCRPGQIVIDAPDLRARHRAELTALKQTIRDGLATAWLASTATIGSRLSEGMRHALEELQRVAEVEDLESRFARNQERLTAIEEPARAVALRNRGAAGRDAGDGSLPAPYARWSFDGDGRDSVGTHHGQLLDGAVVRNGRLILDGIAASMRTAPLDRDLQEKTLEAWVSLSRLNQGGGGVVGVDTPNGQFFDSIVYGEINPRHWMAGSEGFRRTQDPGGPEETAQPGEMIHLVIVYAKDNSITVYRNGERYGATYSKGTVRPFLKAKARFLFGYRSAGANPPLAGEVDEARVYTRALTPDQVFASYRAGPAGISVTEIATVLDAEQREVFLALRAEETRLREQLQALGPATEDPWAVAFRDARTNTANPLHAWSVLMREGPPASVADWNMQWNKLSRFWSEELQARRAFNRSQFKPLWDLRTSENREWFRFGTGLADIEVIELRNGAFSLEPEGDRILQGIQPAGLFSHDISSRHTSVLTSPRFVIESNAIYARAMGQNSQVRVMIENYPDPFGGGGTTIPGTRLKIDELEWFRFDTTFRKGAHAYIEFTNNPRGRAFFGGERFLTSNHGRMPRETVVPIVNLLQGEVPTSPGELAAHYAARLRLAINAWRTESGSEEETALLNFFLRRDLLPTRLADLPQLREVVERYRRLEQEIPVPRQVPGVLETTGFDQPLFERGEHKRPGQRIPRRGLSLFDSVPMQTSSSGRLELAEQTASATNPLTARVMVNRLWQYVFGRGIVGTVDNFGHLGELPTHPALLDHLATRFVEQGWSIKEMLKYLVTSRAFQQSTLPSELAMRTDPANAFLSHASVRRLDAHAIRDGLLATTGQLDLKMFGPGVHVYYSDKTDGGGPKGPLDGNGRRSVYLRVRRNTHSRFLETFDAPKPATTRGTRDITNVPAQALTMLNDPFVIEQAEKWAVTLLAGDATTEQRVRYMFEVALSREPNAAELSLALEYLTELATEHAVARSDVPSNVLIWQDFAQSLFCLKEFIYVR
ncbi:MAG: DUF1553 domain-containing protein [Planctomycetota bacterium]|nr:DUF1553 domain-containing protein [Planctomycetota bacterium]